MSAWPDITHLSSSWVKVIIQVICDGESVNTSRIVKSSKTKHVSVKLSSSSCLFWVNALHKDIVRRIFYLFFYSILFVQSAAWMCSCLFAYICLWILFGPLYFFPSPGDFALICKFVLCHCLSNHYYFVPIFVEPFLRMEHLPATFYNILPAAVCNNFLRSLSFNCRNVF